MAKKLLIVWEVKHGSQCWESTLWPVPHQGGRRQSQHRDALRESKGRSFGKLLITSTHILVGVI